MIKSNLDCNLLTENIAKVSNRDTLFLYCYRAQTKSDYFIMQKVPRFVSFRLENTTISIPVMCTDTEDLDSAARTCIPVTIRIFAQRDQVTESIAQAIHAGIANAANVSESQAW